ncbi:DUF2163 domain-containing protein [Vibrio vulnificus]|uniref:DUF2163 domain-containing protein n=1 Tax=Vibrio vulnificus TaxID=672 RepID=UPI0024E0074F|nr:DUF2163 domain-containing protein [Vibrio vulnificus]MDK2679273.1 DUF2163 domain-containing protein [Vibrio vulnificus]MDK2688051.1 DUF2163 domain-containing protein [Vibrio vulnificus]
MKILPQSVVEQLDRGYVIVAHLVKFDLENPFYFTDAGFDIEHGGLKYVSSGAFLGLDKLTRHAEIRVGEVKFAFSMTNQAIVQTILGTDVYKRPVTVMRCHLSEGYKVLHVEPVWRGKVVGKGDNDDRAQIELKAASRWAEYEKANVWRTSPMSHAKRIPNDNPFKFAAKAAETIYWAGKAGG